MESGPKNSTPANLSMRQSTSSPGIKCLTHPVMRHPLSTSPGSLDTGLGRDNYAYLDDELLEEMTSETEALRGIVSRVAKYGSISSHNPCKLLNQNQRYINHVVEPQDTLQGKFYLLRVLLDD